MRTVFRLSAWVPTALVAGLSGGMAGVPAAHAAPGKGVVAVVPVEGPAVEGEFVALEAAGVRIGSSAAPIALDRVREVRFTGDGPPLALAAGAVGLRVVLKGGEVVRGTFVSGSEDGLEVKPPDFPAVKLAFDVVRRIEADSAQRGPCDEPERQRPPRKGTDVAYAKSGDVLPGTLLSVGADGLVVETAKGRTSRLPWADLVVAHLDNPAISAPEGLAAEVETVGGSRLFAKEVTGTAKSLSMTTRSGLRFEVPTASVRAILWSGGAFVYGSDLPFESKHTPYYADGAYDPKYLERWYAARADRTPEGCPLRVAGTTFRRGIAVRPRSAVTLPLRKAFSRFEARFGIDDQGAESSEGWKGDVTARVLADGKEVWSSGGSVRGGEKARTVGPIDVSGVEALVLEVDFGGEQHIMDRADWGDLVLLRAN